LIVQDLAWLLALTGSSVIAIDQIDTLLVQFDIETDPAPGKAAPWAEDTRTPARLADGPMSLRKGPRACTTVLRATARYSYAVC
jgi:hypothetical protein